MEKGRRRLPGLEREAGGDLRRQAVRSEAAFWSTSGTGRGTNMAPRLLSAPGRYRWSLCSGAGDGSSAVPRSSPGRTQSTRVQVEAFAGLTAQLIWYGKLGTHSAEAPRQLL